MQYDPIKKGLGHFFNRFPWLRILFYRLLNLLLLRAWYIKRELGRFRNQIKGSINILDAGSGFGQYSHYMAGLSPDWKIRGVDIKSDQVEDCSNFFKKIGKDNQVIFEVTDLTVLDEREAYHLILCIDVMEHIEEDEKVFRNFARSLHHGGMVLISTPSDQGGSDVHDEGDESFIEEHVRNGYNLNELNEKLSAAGFSNITIKYSYGIPGKIAWKMSMKYPIILLNLSKLFFIILPFYYILTFPFVILLNLADINIKHKSGTGLIAKAYKN